MQIKVGLKVNDDINKIQLYKYNKPVTYHTDCLYSFLIAHLKIKYFILLFCSYTLTRVL